MKILRKTDGQGLVEFALIFPLQLLIVMFILEMSMILVAKSIVSYACYCAAHAEVLGQDPTEAAALALIPLGDPNGPAVMAQDSASGGVIPGWGHQPKYGDVRSRLKVYRLYDDNSRILNRVTIIQPDPVEYHRTQAVSQHNVAVEVQYPLKLIVPLNFFEPFMPLEEFTDYQQIENQVLVDVNGELCFVLHDSCMLPSTDRLINTTLELRDASQDHETAP